MSPYSNDSIERAMPSSSVLSRVLGEVRAAQAHDASTTAHNVYTSGVFEDAPAKSCAAEESSVLGRVLGEIKAAQSRDGATTAHNSYTSGVFEDPARD